MPLPPELRLLCRRLTSTAPEELLRACPTLVAYVLRCGAALSASSSGGKSSSSSSSEVSMLVHKLKTNVNTLLHGRSASGRFTAISLIKAIIHVGGWECLRTSDSWISGLISIIQKPTDSVPAKELCLVTLTSIYALLRSYQTLVREMVTPTLPSYVTACLQLIKPSSARGRPSATASASLIQTVACSLAKIVPLYPTTLRPFASQIRTCFRAYVAPTLSDRLCVSHALRRASRRLLVLLSYTAPKDGSSEEWAKGFANAVHTSHLTSSQIFRAVHEMWESADAGSKTLRADQDPCGGGGDGQQDLSPWTGVAAGAERLVGLLDFLAEHFRVPTKAPVAIPLGQLMQLTSRLALVTPPLPPNYEEPAQMLNPGISRDERAEMWAALPDIHIAVLRLHLAVVRRLGASSTPLAADMIDQAARVFGASRHEAGMREAAYPLLRELLLLVGPTLARLTVDSVNGLARDCCGDLLQAAGHLEKNNKTNTPATSNGATGSGSTAKQKASASSTDADAFLAPQPANTGTTGTLSSTSHLQAAEALLVVLFSHVPQVHLSPDIRGLLDRTAILCDSRDAMLASCLYPYRGTSGRYYSSILPFLARRFPHDQSVEILRTNLPTAAADGRGDANATMDLDDHVRANDEPQANDGRHNLAEMGTPGGLELDTEEAGPPLLPPIAGAVGGQDSVVNGAEANKKAGEWSTDSLFQARGAKQTVAESLRTDVLAEERAKRANSPLKRKGSNIEPSTVKKRADACKGSRRDGAEEARTRAIVSPDPPAMAKDASPATGGDEDAAHGSDSDSGGSVQINMEFDDDEDEDEDKDE